jgi:predicted thioesterase
MELQPGLTARVELTVTDADTAQALGSGDVPVLGTPRVLALVEAATVAVTAGRLPEGSTTVGTRADLEHLMATPVGGQVVAEARLSRVDGRRLAFTVSVHDVSVRDVSGGDGERLAARGQVERIIVDRQRFLAKATEDAQATEDKAAQR